MIDLELKDEIIDVLKSISKNDKTEYSYTGKLSVTRNNEKPLAGEKFLTPRELANRLIKELNGIRPAFAEWNDRLKK